ncbi:MAG: thioredoxin TrxC [Pseudomonadota bacterium]
MSTPQVFTVRCPGCQTKNRVPADRLNDRPKCGQCGRLLDLSGFKSIGPVVVTDRNFQAEVMASPLPVLLDCWAAWCGPCRMVGPIVEELAQEWQGRVKVAKLNVDENPQTAGRFQIQSIPTLLVFQGGKLLDTMVGALPKGEITRRMAAFM